jgi:poly(3-hydroxyalkanoate) synthetase
MHQHPGGQFPYEAFLLPAVAAASALETACAMTAYVLGLEAGNGCTEQPEGATPSQLALELPTVRLHDFTLSESGVPTLLCTPLALHGAAVADLAAGHSLVAALRDAGIERLFMADWRSAAPEMRFLGIDDYLADLNVLVDHVGGQVDLVGLCQGGWLSLVYAARFPAKVRKLVMAGAPVDTSARQSKLSAIAAATPLATFEGLVKSGHGRVIGREVAELWGTATADENTIRNTLQTPEPVGSPEFEAIEGVFKTWNSCTIDVPGTYYVEVIEKLYKRNELAAGNFVALGQTIDLSRVRLPIYLLAGSADDVVTPEQLLALKRLAGTRREDIGHDVAPCNHLALFMGKQTLDEYWPKIARWIKQPVAEKSAQRLTPRKQRHR